MKIQQKKVLKGIVFTMVVCCVTFSFGFFKPIIGQTQASGAEDQYQMTFTMTFTMNDFSFASQQGYDVIQETDGGYTTEVGQPMIPLKTISVALPDNMKATSVQLTDVHEQSIDGTYFIYPAQPTYPIGTPSQDITFVQPDTVTYQNDQSYPTSYIELTGQNDLAGQSMAALTVYPVHYHPAEKKVTIVTSLTFTIEGVGGYVYGDYLPASLSTTNHEMYQKMVQDMVINPQDVILRSSSAPRALGVDPGTYDYVIITQDSWVSAFQPLQEWKTKKGVPTNIVTTTWIYNDGGYNGSNVDKIKEFVQDAYTNWGTIYVLLGGDTDVVPCNYKTFSSVDSDPVPNDVYYADFDADWVCEVNVGRASVTGPGTGTGKIGTFIDKILTYEINPPLTDYAQNAGFFGFDLDSITHAQQCKTTINNTSIPDNWTVTTVYDSQSGNHRTNVINAINAGQNLLNHADHSSPDYMGTGYVNHDWGVDNGDMDALTNGNKQGIFYSMGCDPAAYDTSNCIGEHYVRNSNGGGMAFIGNSRYGWYNPGSTSTLSMKYDIYFFRSLFLQSHYNLGAAFSDHKNDAYQNDAYYKYCYTELTLLGDPELPIWTENPMNLTGSYPNQIPIGPSSFTVSVTSDGNPVDQASVCLWKGDEVYMTGLTNTAGDVTFTIAPTTQGTMYVTITKHNYLPFEGTAYLLTGDDYPPEIPSTPTGPTTAGTYIQYTYSTSTTDPEHDPVYYKWSWGVNVSDWMGPYASGVTVSASHAWSAPGTYYVRVKAKDTSGFETSWSPALLVTVTEAKPNLTITTITGGLFRVSAKLQNSGQAPAANIQWAINITGGILLTGHTRTGSLAILDVNTIESVTDFPILGFGQMTMTVTVRADGIPEMTKTASGFLVLCYIIM